MLDIKPSCQQCDRDLPPDSTVAVICSYECTFCADCAERILLNVCPNCGGGFEPRPVRPKTEWREGISRSHQGVSEKRIHKPIDPDAHAVFAAEVGVTPPWAR